LTFVDRLEIHVLLELGYMMCFHLCSVVPFNHDRTHERVRSGAGPQILFFEQSLSCRETHRAALADEL
jgi:hypothetical protein